MATANNMNVRFVDLKERMVALLALSKRFLGYVIPKNIKEEIVRAAEKFADGKEGDAIESGLWAEDALTRALVGFFRGSPRFFGNWLSRLKSNHTDSDIIQKLEKELRGLEQATAKQASLEVTQCVVDYEFIHNLFRWAEEEQTRREQDRAAEAEAVRLAENNKKLAREEERKAKQREKLKKDRRQTANELLEAVA